MLGGGKVYHGGLPPYDDGTNHPGGGDSWSDDRAYVHGHDKKRCTSDYFADNEPVLCPDNGQCCVYALITCVRVRKCHVGDPFRFWCLFIHFFSLLSLLCYGTCTSNVGTNLTEFIDHANLEAMLRNLDYASAKLKAHGNPFFFALGFHRPHLPFHFPANFPVMAPGRGSHNVWDAYGPAENISLARQAYMLDCVCIASTKCARALCSLIDSMRHATHVRIFCCD